jgi:ABC-2 type transport system ATP-binding protein
MKAKLRVLVAMTHKAKLLIMDEPTAGLDVEARNEILDMLRNYLEEDEERTILISSHISSDLENLCDDIYLIHDGKIILHEDTDVILDQYGILKVNEAQYATLDQTYILKSHKEHYGYACFTNEKKYYQEKYPDIVIEKGGIDELILMMTGGYR